MCGIAGFCGGKGQEIEQTLLLKNMLNSIRHRGPDDEGMYQSDKIHMGMRRLSIIDLASGNQPLYNEDKRMVIVGNGEIYNYIELRAELINKGHKFATASDIEVIVHLYEEYGDDCVKHLNGMFAFALWDLKLEKLLLARDRVGEKPLFYYMDGEIIVFASEIKAILEYPRYNRQVNERAINLLLTYNYIPCPETMFRGIYRLPAASYLTYREGHITIKEYWQFPNLQNECKKCNERAILEEFYERFMHSVKLRLRSDVPIGAFLSGGVDSSSVVAAMSQCIDYPLKTFSIGFNDDRYNELPFALKVAEKFRTQQYVSVVEDDRFLELLPKAVFLSDNPHGDVSFLPTYEVAALGSRHVKVVMTGDGSDEILGGYDKYTSYLDKYGDSFNLNAYMAEISVFKDDLKQKLCTKDIVWNCDVDKPIVDILAQYEQCNAVNKMLLLDQKLLLEGNNLVKPDRMGMGNSIEARMPFLDHTFIEYVASIPSNLKINGHVTKYVLKKAFENILPAEILYTPKRMFTVPVGEWLRTELKDFMCQLLCDERTKSRGYFHQEVIVQMMSDHIEGRKNYTRELRLLIILELWHRIFIDNQCKSAPSLSELISL